MSLLDELKRQSQVAAETNDSFKKSASTVSADGLIQGVSIPVEVERDGGKLRLYIHVGPDAISDPLLLNAVLDSLEEKFDLAIWRSRSNQSSSGFKNSYKKRW